MGMARVSAPRNLSASSPRLAAASRSRAVSVGPGQTTLAVTPARAASRAMVLVNEITPPLAPAYTDSRDEPTRAASEAMLTMRPQRASTMAGSTARHQRSTPL